MKLGIELTIDLVFKKIFGSKENKDILIDIVNAVLEKAGEEKVVDLEVLNPYTPQDFLSDKLSIVDIKAKSEMDEWFIIEMQINVNMYFPRRLLYYWAKHYQQQLKQGEKYHLLRKVAVIAFCKEALPINTTDYYNHFSVLEVNKHLLLSDHLAIHTIELEKFLNSIENVSDSLERWTYVLKYGKELDPEALPEQLSTPAIRHAIKEIEVFTKEEIEIERYNARVKQLMDYNSALDERFESGKEVGLQKGEKIGLQKGEQISISTIKQAIIDILQTRFAEAPETIISEIQAIDNLDHLQALLKKAISSGNYEEFNKLLINLATM